MVKTKPVVQKKNANKQIVTSHKKTTKEEQKKIIDKNITEVEPYDKGTSRAKGDWWDDLLSGETCRTYDIEKVHKLIDRAAKERRSFIIQTNAEAHNKYSFYITNTIGDKETRRK